MFIDLDACHSVTSEFLVHYHHLLGWSEYQRYCEKKLGQYECGNMLFTLVSSTFLFTFIGTVANNKLLAVTVSSSKLTIKHPPSYIWNFWNMKLFLPDPAKENWHSCD